MAFTAKATDPGIWPKPWKPAAHRGFTPRCWASQLELTMLTPSSTAWAPAVGNRAPVVNPSICSGTSPASAIACLAVSRVTAPNGRGRCRATGLWAYPTMATCS